MIQLIIGVLCVLAVIFIQVPGPSKTAQNYDPWVILALEELHEEEEEAG